MSAKTREKAHPGRILLLLIAAVLTGFAAAMLVRELADRTLPPTCRDYIEAAAAESGVPMSMLCAVIRTESDFDPLARSGAGAIGMMQITPDTLDWINMKRGTSYTAEELTDAEINIGCGAFLLGYLHSEFGHWEEALAAYNAGRARVRGWLRNSAYCADGRLQVQRIPYPETRNYVKKCMRLQALYEDSGCAIPETPVQSAS